MQIAVFNTKPYDREFLTRENEKYHHELLFLECHLSPETVALAKGATAICVFVNDQLPEPVLSSLKSEGIRLIALRCAGYNNVDLEAAKALGIGVVRVPAYSPYSVAEHTLGLILSLNRKIHRAYNRVRESNFSLDGLLGFDLHGKTIGVVGTGNIGRVVIDILLGFGCQVLAHDLYPDPAYQEKPGVTYVPLASLFAQSDVITLHCPLSSKTRHMINAETLQQMKPGVMLINTSRGGLIDTIAVINGLKSGKIGALGLDVYEEEAQLFFEDLSCQVLSDDIFSRLLTFPNVLITGHQAFFTKEALANIADTTLNNITAYETTGTCLNQL